MVVRGIQEFFELRIGNRIFVDIEGLNLHGVFVEAPRALLPWVLHVHTDIIHTLNLNAFHFEIEIAPRNANHAFRRRSCRLC